MGSEDRILGFIMGSNKFEINKLDTFSEREISTEYGNTFAWVGEKCIILPRHGKYSNIPPHKINHHANMQAFQKLGVLQIISFTSVGSLKHALKPTHMLMPDDYINTATVNTYFNDKIHHIIPGLDNDFREEIFKEISQLSNNINFNGIYIQTRGPRLETKAEIQMLKTFGDVVGMTMASEATLAKELEISYANISIVDNYCNGIIDEPLTFDMLKENQMKNIENVEEIIRKLI